MSGDPHRHNLGGGAPPSGARWLFLLLVFLAELAAWAAIGYGAFGLAGGGRPGVVAATVAVAAAIVAWGRWAAPRSDAPPRLAAATKVAVFGAAVALLAAVGRLGWAAGLAVLIAVAHVGVSRTR